MGAERVQGLLFWIMKPMADLVDFQSQLWNVLLLHKGALDVHKVQWRRSRVTQGGTRRKGLCSVGVEWLAIQLDRACSERSHEDHLRLRVSKAGQCSGPAGLDHAAKLWLVTDQKRFVITLRHHGP